MEKPTDGQGVNTKLALKRARRWARAGNTRQAQLWINRACEFSYVTKDQIRYMQRLIQQCKRSVQ
jgi:hypothetical protein